MANVLVFEKRENMNRLSHKIEISSFSSEWVSEWVNEYAYTDDREVDRHISLQLKMIAVWHANKSSKLTAHGNVWPIVQIVAYTYSNDIVRWLQCWCLVFCLFVRFSYFYFLTISLSILFIRCLLYARCRLQCNAVPWFSLHLYVINIKKHTKILNCWTAK